MSADIAFPLIAGILLIAAIIVLWLGAYIDAPAKRLTYSAWRDLWVRYSWIDGHAF